MATVLTWLDGAAVTVPADDPRLVEQRRQRALCLHVARLRPLTIEKRRKYLADLDRRDGAELGQAVRVAFTRDWEQRR